MSSMYLLSNETKTFVMRCKTNSLKLFAILSPHSDIHAYLNKNYRSIKNKHIKEKIFNLAFPWKKNLDRNSYLISYSHTVTKLNRLIIQVGPSGFVHSSFVILQT